MTLNQTAGRSAPPRRRKIDVADDVGQRRFPEVTLAFVTNLSVDAIAVLGDMVKRSFDRDQANPAVLGRWWVDDVLARCWRLALATHEDRFGPTGDRGCGLGDGEGAVNRARRLTNTSVAWPGPRSPRR